MKIKYFIFAELHRICCEGKENCQKP